MTTTPEVLPVTQADKDAYYDIFHVDPREDCPHASHTLQRLARHRLASTPITDASSEVRAENERLREGLGKIANLGSCARAKTPAYKLFQEAIDIAMGVL